MQPQELAADQLQAAGGNASKRDHYSLANRLDQPDQRLRRVAARFEFEGVRSFRQSKKMTASSPVPVSVSV